MQRQFAAGYNARMTPVRQQYLSIKRQYPDAIVFFRLGDFYETFDDDAKIVSAELDIVLTSREMGRGHRIPLAGVPCHSADVHLARLVDRGYKVAIVEQIGDQMSRGPMERRVVRVVTPGTIIEPHMLEAKKNNYLACVVFDKKAAGLAFVDVSTGEFCTTELRGDRAREAVENELQRLQPAECLVQRDEVALRDTTANPSADSSLRLTQLEARYFAFERCRDAILEHFGLASLEGLGFANWPLAIRAAGAIIRYLGETQSIALAQLDSLHTYRTDEFMVLDAGTRRNLELTATSRAGAIKGSLVWVLDRTQTAMGGRLLRRWINEPLLDVTRIKTRQRAIGELVSCTALRARLREKLKGIGDLERIITRVSHKTATPREVRALATSLQKVSAVIEALEYDTSTIVGKVESPALLSRGKMTQCDDTASDRRSTPDISASTILELRIQLDSCEDIVELIDQAIVADPPNTVSEGGIVATGFSDELDQLRAAAGSARQWIAALEAEERERTGIKSLKVGYNRVFGYYIEVSNPNLELPRQQRPRGQASIEVEAGCSCRNNREHLEHCLGYVRKQTLVGAERFVTPGLKEREAFILGAQDRIVELESRIFRQVCDQVAAARQRILATASTLAQIDVFAALAEVAVDNRYICPEIDDGDEITIVGGRHPMVELMLGEGRFVPNDVRLSNRESQVIILTGPNMAGKSTYSLMVALIVLMAQIGSYVPADSARIGLVDRIFTRVGAQHDISSGQSTFLVEMAEAANILNNATSRSLVILDEVGRGTSTFDGVAIARAIVEHIHNHPKLGCKTLFATHYHELTELEAILPRVRNYRMDVLEEGDRVVFLHKVVPGGADRSYGIHVAKLAGVPKAVIRRAEEILKQLQNESLLTGMRSNDRTDQDVQQLPLFGQVHPVIEELRTLDILSMTPLEAITKLFELQRRAAESTELF